MSKFVRKSLIATAIIGAIGYSLMVATTNSGSDYLNKLTAEQQKEAERIRKNDGTSKLVSEMIQNAKK